MRWRTAGDGFPAVFVHGYLGGGAQWQTQMESPPDGIRIIAPCLPGFGNSAGLPPPQSIGGFARRALDFLSANGVNHFFLLGHSMGGMIAQEMITQAPDRVAALVLYATGALGVIPGRFESMDESRKFVLANGVGKAAARLPAKWLSAGKNSVHYDCAVAIANTAKLPAHLAGLTAMETWDGRAMLKKIACPSLIIWGDLDQSYPREQIDFLHKNIAGATLKIIPAAAHLAHMEFPEQFQTILHDFLNQCKQQNPFR